MSGHVFVVQSDLAHLRTDAWLLPTDLSFGAVRSWIPERWRDELTPDNSRFLVTASAMAEDSPHLFEDWKSEKRRVLRFDRWPGQSMPWLANVGGDENRSVEWYLEAVEQFIAEASTWAREFTRRAKPLIGVPAVGTGFGGKWEEKAAVLDALFNRLCQLATTHDTDIVMALYDAPSFAAVQFARQRNVESETYLWPIEDHLIPVARDLGEKARKGELVMFMGSGVSVGAGLPTWKEFLRNLGEQALLTPEELQALLALDAMDAGSILERRLGGREALKAVVRQMLDVNECSIQHALIASIPHQSAVTLNYDRLYELASKRVVGDVAVLPHDRGLAAERWLLKLHGCIDRGQLVLAREDYLRFGERRTALAGIVQALLITKHMLFVGFGMTDANFLRILDDVRRSLGDTTSKQDLARPVGTVLMLRPEPLRNALFDGDLNIQSMYSGTNHTEDIRHAVRQLEIFLDLVSFESATRSAFFFDKTFDAMLSERDRGFRDALLHVHATFADTPPNSIIWERFLRFMNESGMN